VPKRPDSALWLATPIQHSLLDGEEGSEGGRWGWGWRGMMGWKMRQKETFEAVESAWF
jgi:hypothetical protein